MTELRWYWNQKKDSAPVWLEFVTKDLFSVDRPKASSLYTVEQLEEMGFVGVYKKIVPL